jgi:hypothetical protein
MSQDKFDRLESKIDKLDERLDVITVVLERNTGSLETHIKRTNLLEERLMKIDDEEIKPIQKHVALVSNGFKGIVWFCSIITAIASGLLLLSQAGLFDLPSFK